MQRRRQQFGVGTYARARALRNLGVANTVYSCSSKRVSKRIKCIQQQQHTFRRHSSYFIEGGGGEQPLLEYWGFNACIGMKWVFIAYFSNEDNFLANHLSKFWTDGLQLLFGCVAIGIGGRAMAHHNCYHLNINMHITQ